MTDFRERYKRVGFGMESMEINRALRSQRRAEFRRETRAEHYSRHRNLDENLDDSLDALSPQVEKVSAEELLAKARQNRLERLHRWRKEKEHQKKIEKQQAKPIFKVGVMHHKAFSPPSLQSPLSVSKLCKTKSITDLPQKRVTRATERRLAAKATNKAVKRNILKQMKKEKEEEKPISNGISFAPEDYQFRAPKGIKAIPLFGLLALDSNRADPTSSEIMSLFESSKPTWNKIEKESIDNQKVHSQVNDEEPDEVEIPQSLNSPEPSPAKKIEVFGIHNFTRVTRQKTTNNKIEKEITVKNETLTVISEVPKTPINRFRRRKHANNGEVDTKSPRIKQVMTPNRGGNTPVRQDFKEQKLLLNKIENVSNSTKAQNKTPEAPSRYRPKRGDINIEKNDTPENSNKVNIRKSKRNVKLMNEASKDKQESMETNKTSEIPEDLLNNASKDESIKIPIDKIKKKISMRKRKRSLTTNEKEEKFIDTQSRDTAASDAPQKRSRFNKKFFPSPENSHSLIQKKVSGENKNAKENLSDGLKKTQKIETEISVDKSGGDSDEEQIIKTKSLLGNPKITTRRRANADNDESNRESLIPLTSSVKYFNDDMESSSDVFGKQKDNSPTNKASPVLVKRPLLRKAKLSKGSPVKMSPTKKAIDKKELSEDKNVLQDSVKSEEKTELEKLPVQDSKSSAETNKTPIFSEKETRSRKNKQSLNSSETTSKLLDNSLNSSEINIRKTRRSGTKNATPKTPQEKVSRTRKGIAKQTKKMAHIEETMHTSKEESSPDESKVQTNIKQDNVANSPKKFSRLQKFKQFINTMEKYTNMDETDKESDTNAENVPRKTNRKQTRRSDIMKELSNVSQDESKTEEITEASSNVTNKENNLKNELKQSLNSSIKTLETSEKEDKVDESIEMVKKSENVRSTRRSNPQISQPETLQEEMTTDTKESANSAEDSCDDEGKKNSDESLNTPETFVRRTRRSDPKDITPRVQEKSLVTQKKSEEIQEDETISSKKSMQKRKSSLNSTDKTTQETPKVKESPARRKSALKKTETINSIDEQCKVNTEQNSSIGSDNGKKEKSFYEQRLSKSPEELNKPPAFFSPYIVTTRGKRSMRKEQKVRLGIDTSLMEDEIPTKDTVMQNLNISIEEEEKTAQYFKFLLNKEIERLMELCQTWKKIKEEEGVSEDAQYKINAAVGQTMLLINKKFERFNRLVLDCETGKGEMLVTCKDLQGFWDMMYMEVKNCEDRFTELEKDKARGWVEEEIVIALPKKKVLKKPIKKPIVNKPSSIRAHILAARKKKIEGNENNKDLDVNIDSKQKTEVVSKQTPKRQSLRISPKNSPKILSRRSQSSPRKENKRRSLLEMVQFSEASKSVTSPLAMMKVSQMCKTPPEVHLDESIVYINSDQTPAKSILKRTEDNLNESLKETSYNKVNFKEKSRKSKINMDENAKDLQPRVERRLNYENESMDTSNLNESVTEQNVQLTPLQSLENKVEKKVEQVYFRDVNDDTPNLKNQGIMSKLRNGNTPLFTAPLTPRPTRNISKAAALEEIEKVENKEQKEDINISNNSEMTDISSKSIRKEKKGSRKSVRFTAENLIPISASRRSARLTIFEGIGNEPVSPNDNPKSRQSVRFTGENLTPKTSSRRSNRLTVFGSTEVESSSPLPNGDLISFNTPD